MARGAGWRERAETVLDDDRLEPVAILVFNAVPLVGVLVWEWSLAAIMVLYWAENGVVGLLNVPKMVLASQTGEESNTDVGSEVDLDVSTALLTAFFTVFFAFHYGMFWVVHGVFVFALFVFQAPVALLAAAPTVLLGLGALTAQRAYEAYHEFYRAGRFREVTPRAQMGAPYRRVVVLHVTLVLGGFVVLGIGAPVGALLLLVVLKTGYDLAAWARSDAA